MKKQILMVGISATVIFNTVSATPPVLTKAEINKRSKEILAKAGIDVPDSTEISIVSANKFIDIRHIKTDEYDVYMATKMKEYLSMNAEQQENGYVNDSEPRAKELMELKHIAPYHQKKYKNVLSTRQRP